MKKTSSEVPISKENSVNISKYTQKQNKYPDPNIILFYLLNFIRSKYSLPFCLSILMLLYMQTVKPVIIGDGHEYFAMTISLFNHLSLDLQPADIAMRAAIEQGRGISFPPTQDYYGYAKALNGNYYPIHFWAYSLASLPFFVILHFLNINELPSLQITNAVLLLASFWVITYCFDDKFQRLIMLAFSVVNPIVLYIGWTGAEVFSYSFVVMAISFAVAKKYNLAVLFSSIASLQNPPIIMFTLYLIYLGLRDSNFDLNLLKKLILSSAITVAPYIFYMIYYHVPNLIVSSGVSTFNNMSINKFINLFTDLNFGMILYIPILFILAVIALFIGVKKKDDKIIFLWVTIVLMVTITTTQGNWNPGIMYIHRYCTYMIPIIILIVLYSVKYYSSASSTRLLGITLIIGFTLSFFTISGCMYDYDYFNYVKFSKLSQYVIVCAPELSNPPYENFGERSIGEEVDYTKNLPILFVYDGNVRKILTDYAHITDVEKFIEPEYKNETIKSIEKSGIGYINSHKIILPSDVDSNKIHILYS
jgi:hypothetical protein